MNNTDFTLLSTQTLHRKWGWVLALGIVFVLMGSYGLTMAVGYTFTSMMAFATLLLVGAVIHFVDVFKARRLKGAFWHAFLAILYLVTGLIVFNEPFFASTMLTMLLACMFIAIGLTRIFWGFSMRELAGYGWIIFGGFITLILGVMILMQWPASGLWFIGLMIAIELLFTGWAYIFMAFLLRRA